MTQKILSALSPPAMTTTQRDAIPAGRRPPGGMIFNTTLNELQVNYGTDATPNWQMIKDGSIADADVAAAAALAFTKLGTWTWAYFGGAGNYSAGGDKNYRDFTNCTVGVDLRSPNYSTWLTAPSNLRWRFPEVGKYLVFHQISIVWNTSSEIGGIIFDDSTGNPLMNGIRAYVTSGNDALGVYGGPVVAGIVDITSTLQAHTFHPGGYTSLGGSVAHTVTAIRLPI